MTAVCLKVLHLGLKLQQLDQNENVDNTCTEFDNALIGQYSIGVPF